MKSPQATAVFLRILAVLQLLTGLIASAPPEWIAVWYAWLGLGVMPHLPAKEA